MENNTFNLQTNLYHFCMIPYRKDLLEKSRENKKNMPPAEVLLWTKIRNKQLGVSFRRQMPIGNYIADFACKSPKIIVEVDGESHIGKEEYDAKRDSFLTSKGFHLIHVTDTEVLRDIDAVLNLIFDTIQQLK